MKAYPSYTNSNTTFLGVIPSSWITKRGKYVFTEVKQFSATGSELLLSVSEYFGIKPRKEIIEENGIISRAETLIGYKKCKSGDLVINIMLAWKRGLGVTQLDGIVSPSYSVFRPFINVNRKYLHYLLRTDLYVSEFKRRSTGIINSRLRLYPTSFLDIPILIPELSEQQAIANFLDHKTAQIDALIDQKQRQIERLQEYRTALINQAVTKGLDPNVPMKDSGIEWLGEIPEHWSVSSVRNYFDVKLGKMLNRSKQDASEIIKPYLRAANIHWNKVLLDEVGINEMGFSKSQLSRYRLHPGDLLITEGGVTVGRSAIWNGELEDCYYQNSLNRARALRHISTKWLYYWMFFLTNNGYIDVIASKATFGHLTNEKLLDLPIVIPSNCEHAKIISNIEDIEPKIDEQISLINQQINLLIEYRTALISEAVTGKIDVRDWKGIENGIQTDCS